MAKTKKLSSLKETHGRDDSKTPKFQPTTLSQLFGETNGSERYNTMDTEEYERYLNEDLNSAELRRHAVEVAHVPPTTSVERTKKRLILEHKKYVAGFTSPLRKAKKEITPTKEALRIMAEVK